jgi:hypothetical protein
MEGDDAVLHYNEIKEHDKLDEKMRKVMKTYSGEARNVPKSKKSAGAIVNLSLGLIHERLLSINNKVCAESATPM